jgi:hypothetical protein
MWCILDAGEVRTGFQWEDVRGKHHLEVPGVDGKIIIKWNFK